jgi:hypothetical protein
MRRRLLSPLLAACLLAALPASAAAREEPVIPLGAKAAGQDVGGLTLSQAAAVLEQRFGAAMAQPVQVRIAGHRLATSMKAIDYAFDPLRTARRANIAAREAEPAPDGTSPVDVPLHTSWDAEKLSAFAAKADRRSRVRVRNATLRMTLKRMVTRKARPSGRS